MCSKAISSWKMALISNNPLKTSGGESCVGYTWRTSKSIMNGQYITPSNIFCSLKFLVWFVWGVPYAIEPIVANWWCSFDLRLGHDLFLPIVFTLLTLLRTVHMCFNFFTVFVREQIQKHDAAGITCMLLLFGVVTPTRKILIESVWLTWMLLDWRNLWNSQRRHSTTADYPACKARKALLFNTRWTLLTYT